MAITIAFREIISIPNHIPVEQEFNYVRRIYLGKEKYDRVIKDRA
jgi:hypothetical protein